MEIRKATILVAIVMLVVAASGCKTVAKSDYIVVSLKDVSNPSLDCGWHPEVLNVRENTKWIVIANYSPKDPGDPGYNSMKVTVSPELTNKSEVLVQELMPGEIMTFKLKKNLPSGSEWGITAMGDPGECTSGLPNPRIIIP